MWQQSLLSWLICRALVILKDLYVLQNVKKNHQKKKKTNSLCIFQKTILIKPMVFMAPYQRLWANFPMHRSCFKYIYYYNIMYYICIKDKIRSIGNKADLFLKVYPQWMGKTVLSCKGTYLQKQMCIYTDPDTSGTGVLWALTDILWPRKTKPLQTRAREHSLAWAWGIKVSVLTSPSVCHPCAVSNLMTM